MNEAKRCIHLEKEKHLFIVYVETNINKYTQEQDWQVSQDSSDITVENQSLCSTVLAGITLVVTMWSKQVGSDNEPHRQNEFRLFQDRKRRG